MITDLENNKFHKPVLLDKILKALQAKDGETYVDCTFGAGGYSKAILQAANCNLIAFDRDKSVLPFANNIKQNYQNFTFINQKFSEIKLELAKINIEKVDAIIVDLGVSSMQLDDDKRGFSFNSEAILDMRMDQSAENIGAFEVVNQMPEAELKRIINDFGDERRAGQIAKKIIEKRQENPIHKSVELAEIVRGVYGHRYSKTDHATKTFQAIRIFVNQEMEELQLLLEASKELLEKNGRLIVVSFHSLEDGYVKNFLKSNISSNAGGSRYDPPITISEGCFIAKNKSIKPTEKEIFQNHRARSSRMRIAIKK